MDLVAAVVAVVAAARFFRVMAEAVAALDC
jgi:hypothetical protein